MRKTLSFAIEEAKVSVPALQITVFADNTDANGVNRRGLGEFDNMSQAIRGLEFRGLRQFFNSRSYKGSPMPVFLAQSEETGPVGLYMGELSSPDSS